MTLSLDRLILILIATIVVWVMLTRGFQFIRSRWLYLQPGHSNGFITGGSRSKGSDTGAGVLGGEGHIPGLTRREMMSHSTWVIKRDGLAREIAGLQLVVQQQRLAYMSVFPVSARDPVQKEFVRQLEVQQAMLQVEIEELNILQLKGKVKSRGLWDMVKIRAYQWAVYNK